MHEIHCQVQVLKKHLTDKKRLVRTESANKDVNNCHLGEEKEEKKKTLITIGS